MELRELGYISNILSLSRIALLVPIYYLLQWQTQLGNYAAAFVMVVAALTDAFDGRLARKLGQRTDLGRLLDPIADKIGVAIIMLILVKVRGLPAWFVTVVIGRDLAILLLGLVLTVKVKSVVESNMLGKLTVNALALTILIYTLELAPARQPSLWLSVGMLTLSSMSYAGKMMRIAREYN